MKLLAGFLAVALAQEEDRWGYYDYYGNGVGKSQVSQTGEDGQLANIAQTRGTLGNGRICWNCLEKSYGECLGASAVQGDAKRHGAGYCTGEDYFCYISERRIIRHDGNDYNKEFGQPWSAGAGGPGGAAGVLYQEENAAFAGSNMVKNTNIRIEMGCQQPMACLRQMNMNYKIEMGIPYHVSAVSIPIATLPVVHGGLTREGMCRVGLDWKDYANGMHTTDNWRMQNWQSFNSDRRYGAVRNHYHFGKGTESVCHHCCDPLLEFAAVGANTDPQSAYDYMGCNFNAIMSATDITTAGNVDGSAGSDISGNAFLERAHIWDTPEWYDNRQYHGMFRNPHTQYPHDTRSYNLGGAHPNAR